MYATSTLLQTDFFPLEVMVTRKRGRTGLTMAEIVFLASILRHETRSLLRIRLP
jgi:hypothetical protein